MFLSLQVIFKLEAHNEAFIVLCVTANNAVVTLALSCAGLPTWSLLEQAIVCLNLRVGRVLRFQARRITHPQRNISYEGIYLVYIWKKIKNKCLVSKGEG